LTKIPKLIKILFNVTKSTSEGLLYDPYAALRIRDYRNLVLGVLSSSLGEQMLDVAVGWEIYARTNSAAALGFAGLAEALPIIVLSLAAGQASDRYSRRLILLIVQIANILFSLGLALVSATQAPIWIVYALLLGTGTARAFKSPARAAFLPQLVPPSLLTSAITWNSSFFQLASVVGPMLGGFLLARFSNYSLVYILNAVFAFIFFLLLTRVRKSTTVSSSAKSDRSWKGVLAGARFIKGEEPLLASLTLDLFAVLLGGATALLPIYAKDILHVDASGLGWLRAAPAMGAVAMALVLAHLPSRLSPLQRSGPALIWSVVGFGIATIVFGASKSYPLSLAMLFLTGAFDNISVVIRATLLQVLTPDAMRGRVSAVNFIFIGISNKVGAFESGITAAAFGPIASVVGGGIGTLLVVAGTLWKWPGLLKLKTLEKPEK
jgi:MFS family permease